MPSSLQAISGLFGSSSPRYGSRSAQLSVGSAVMAAVSQVVQAVCVGAGRLGRVGRVAARRPGGRGSGGTGAGRRRASAAAVTVPRSPLVRSRPRCRRGVPVAGAAAGDAVADRRRLRPGSGSRARRAGSGASAAFCGARRPAGDVAAAVLAAGVAAGGTRGWPVLAAGAAVVVGARNRRRRRCRRSPGWWSAGPTRWPTPDAVARHRPLVSRGRVGRWPAACTRPGS